MPTAPSLDDRIALGLIEQWKILASGEVRGIAMARRDPDSWATLALAGRSYTEPDGSFVTDPPDIHDLADTASWLVGRIESRYPKLDLTCFLDLEKQIRNWYRAHIWPKIDEIHREKRAEFSGKPRKAVHEEAAKILLEARRSLVSQDDLEQLLDAGFGVLDTVRDEILARRPELRGSQPAIDEVGAESPNGVSLYDVAYLIEEDDKAATNLVKRWSDLKKIKAESIGKCPLDGRRRLYRLSEILSDLKKILSLDSGEMSKYRQALAAKLRAPRTE